jgi:hypothetical protein
MKKLVRSSNCSYLIKRTDSADPGSGYYGIKKNSMHACKHSLSALLRSSFDTFPSLSRVQSKVIRHITLAAMLNGTLARSSISLVAIKRSKRVWMWL